MRRLLALGAIVCGLAGLGGTAAMAAPAAPTAACNGQSGVTVVVDFGSLGGGTQVRCAPGDPSSGLAALTAAGFSYGFVQGQPGLVCVIDRKPDPCNGAPSDAYWAYHHGQAGGSWSYSNEGAGTYDPKPGSVEGWAFGANRKPSVAPPGSTTTTTTAPPPTAAPKPTTSTPAGGAGATTTTAPTGVTPTPSGTGEPDTTTTSADASETTDTTDPDETTSTDPDRTDDRNADGADDDGDRIAGAASDDEIALTEVSDTDDGGSGSGALVAGIVLVVLVLGAVLERRRRAPA